MNRRGFFGAFALVVTAATGIPKKWFSTARSMLPVRIVDMAPIFHVPGHHFEVTFKDLWTKRVVYDVQPQDFEGKNIFREDHD